jgi:hypothetical protein
LGKRGENFIGATLAADMMLSAQPRRRRSTVFQSIAAAYERQERQ